MLTGDEILRIFKLKIDRSYTGYIDTPKLNRLLNIVVTKLIDDKVSLYRQNQKIADEIQPLVVYKKPININNNKVPVKNMSIKAVSIAGLNVTLTVENEEHNLNVADTITLSNIALSGLTGLNATGTITIKTTNSLTFVNTGAVAGTYVANSLEMSSPKFLGDYYRLLNLKCNFSSVGAVNFITGISRIAELGNAFGKATTRFPKAELSNNFIYIEPSTVACTSAEAYYIRKMPKDIDTSNSVYDYSLFLNDKMIDKITDDAALFWAGYVKDPESFKIQESIIIDNP